MNFSASGFGQQSLVITNNGNGSLRIVDATIGSTEFSISPDPLVPTCIPPGSSQTLQVIFTPHVSGSNITTTLTLTTDVAGCPTISIPVTAN
jgi:hypothetical protein